MTNNFGDIPAKFSTEKSLIIIIPVPYDETSTWGKGADKGPKAIIDASAHMELYDIETNSEVYKKGIFTDLPIKEKSSPEKMVEAVKNRVSGYLNKNKFPVLLGGEHSISIGSIQAFAQKFPNLCVLQLDAHSDLRQEYEGSKLNHACAMARAQECCPVIQVGIRSMDAGEKKYMVKENIFFAEKILQEKNKEWIEKVVSRLSQNVYLTIDLDVFDPSIMPSTGTPEPGGLLWHDVLELVKKVVQKRNLVGFDIVELAPTNNPAPDFTAAKLIYKILSYKFWGLK